MEARRLRLRDAEVVIRPAAVNELVPLRHRILRAGLPVEEAHFDGDALPTTRHAGAFVGESGDGGLGLGGAGEGGVGVVSCATLMLNAWQAEPAWQLRGMASDARFRGSGAGAGVLRFLTEWVIAEPPAGAEGVRLFWCNARVPALAFYEKQGWAVVSDEFVIPTAGPHRRMVRRVP